MVTSHRSRTGTVLANTAGVVFAVVMAFPVYWVLNIIQRNIAAGLTAGAVKG